MAVFCHKAYHAWRFSPSISACPGGDPNPMKLLAVVVVAGLEALSVWAGESEPRLARKVTVCMGADLPEAYVARVLASDMFQHIGVNIEWQLNTPACRANSSAIQIRLQQASNGILPLEALAYAKPIEGIHIVVFYDRVRQMVVAARVPFLLAHVLVHEISHILQGCSQHSYTGIMKAQWDSVDYSKMFPNPLSFTPTDIRLIHLGMDWRESRSRAHEKTPTLLPVP
jgi:hypothetical protein